MISLLPLTAETHHLLNTPLLTRLPVGSENNKLFSRCYYRHQAMLRLLETRHISHAVLDVFEHEPLPVTDPMWSNPNITVLPHISAPTDRNTSIKIAADNIKQYRELKIIPNTVNAQLGY